MTQRLTPDRLAELRDAPRHLLWGSEIAELFAHIDAVAADAVILAHAHADTARELEDARADLAALTTLRPVSERSLANETILYWRFNDDLGEWLACTGSAAGPVSRGATHWTPLFTPSLPKPVTPA